MKTPNQLRAEVESLLNLLLSAEIAIDINPVVRTQGNRLIRVTWGGCYSGALFRGDFASIDDYCRWIDDHAFSAVLYDGSLLQLSYDFALTQELVGHRLGFYPCPFDLDEEWVRGETLSEVIAVYRQQKGCDVRLRSPLRFDYDAAAAKGNHPAVHLTMQAETCRWPVVAPLSPGHLIQFVFKNFYPELWYVHSFLREWPRVLGKRTIQQHEQCDLHIECAR